MIIVYRPEDGEAQRWDLDEVNIMSAEAEAMERVTRLEWGELQGKLTKGSMLAMRAFAWALTKRSEPTLRYSDFAPAAKELEIDFNAAERAEIRREINRAADAGEMDEDDRAAALAALADPEDAQPEEDASAEVEAAPKDSADAASPTSD